MFGWFSQHTDPSGQHPPLQQKVFAPQQPASPRGETQQLDVEGQHRVSSAPSHSFVPVGQTFNLHCPFSQSPDRQ